MRINSASMKVALLLLIAVGCDKSYNPTTAPPVVLPPIPPAGSAQDGLWTVSGAPGEIIRLDPTQLLTTGTRTPATRLFTSSASLFALNSVAFDSNGMIWVASQDDSLLLAFAPASGDSIGFGTPAVIIAPTSGSISGPTGIAFDRDHGLWVANFASGTIVRYDRSQLATSGAPVPSVTISGIAHPTGLAFDAGGALWVSDLLSNTVSEYSVAQLSTSGERAPSVVLAPTSLSLANPSGIAFDAANNLWVANTANQSVTAFRPPQRAASGAPTPFVTLEGGDVPLGTPAGLAFDSEGSLWVVGLIGTLNKFSLASIAASGPAVPDVRIRVDNRLLFWGVAFWPKPVGLPLN